MRLSNLLISEHKIFEGKPPPTPSKGKWSKIDVSTIASAKMAMQAKVKRTSSSDKIKNTTLNNPLYVKVNTFDLNMIIVARAYLRILLAGLVNNPTWKHSALFKSNYKPFQQGFSGRKAML